MQMVKDLVGEDGGPGTETPERKRLATKNIPLFFAKRREAVDCKGVEFFVDAKEAANYRKQTG